MGEHILKWSSAVIGAGVGILFGGWNMLLNALAFFVIIDWLTGWGAAWYRGELRSRVGFTGIVRKVAIFVVVAIAHLVDMILGDLHVFRDAVVFFYLANELLSIIENLGKMNVPMPDFLRNAVHIFQSKAAPAENPQLIPEAQPDLVKQSKTEEAAAASTESDDNKTV